MKTFELSCTHFEFPFSSSPSKATFKISMLKYDQNVNNTSIWTSNYTHTLIYTHTYTHTHTDTHSHTHTLTHSHTHTYTEIHTLTLTHSNIRNPWHKHMAWQQQDKVDESCGKNIYSSIPNCRRKNATRTWIFICPSTNALQTTIYRLAVENDNNIRVKVFYSDRNHYTTRSDSPVRNC